MVALAATILITAPAFSLNRRCRSLLSSADPNDAFDTVGLACPFETVGQFPNRACRNSLDPPPVIQPTFLSEANRLPDYEFQNMVFGEFAGICDDIFASPEFTILLGEIEEMDAGVIKRLQTTLLGGSNLQLAEPSRAQRQMATVFSQIDWSYCHKVSKGVNVVEHAFFKSDTGQIVLYATACLAQDIYSLGLDSLSLAHRFALISAHEVGHAIDHAAGSDLRRPTAEDFATLVGTFFAQCHGRVVAHLIREAAELTETARQKTERATLLERYTCYEDLILELRAETKKLIKQPRDLRKRTRADGVFSCATFLDNQGGAEE